MWMKRIRRVTVSFDTKTRRWQPSWSAQMAPFICLIQSSRRFWNHNWLCRRCTVERSWNVFLVYYHITQHKRCRKTVSRFCEHFSICCVDSSGIESFTETIWLARRTLPNSTTHQCRPTIHTNVCIYSNYCCT